MNHESLPTVFSRAFTPMILLLEFDSANFDFEPIFAANSRHVAYSRLAHTQTANYFFWSEFLKFHQRNWGKRRQAEPGLGSESSGTIRAPIPRGWKDAAEGSGEGRRQQKENKKKIRRDRTQVRVWKFKLTSRKLHKEAKIEKKISRKESLRFWRETASGCCFLQVQQVICVYGPSNFFLSLHFCVWILLGPNCVTLAKSCSIAPQLNLRITLHDPFLSPC